MNESENDIVTEVASMFFSAYIADFISLILVFVSFILILNGSIKLFKKYTAPGVNLIFYSVMGFLISFVIYSGYVLIFSEEENEFFEQLTSVLFSALFLLGSAGVLNLSKYLINGK
jgi:predicted ATP-grasp superfamily ATP-dependent carboligase